MEYKKIDNDHYAVKMVKGEEILEQIAILCEQEKIMTGEITGIGACDKVELGLFNPNTKEYETTVKEGMFEITSLVGNISRKDDKVYLHCHINFSDRNLNVFGGHLLKCYISTTGEIIVTLLHGRIRRKFSPEIGLNLFN